MGKKWRSAGWQKATRVDGDDNTSPYYRDVSGLDPLRAYQFRVTGYTGSVPGVRFVVGSGIPLADAWSQAPPM